MLRRIETEENMPAQEVTIKPINQIEVISVRNIIPSYSEVGSLFNEAYAIVGKFKIQPAGPPIGIYHDPEHQEQDVDVEVAVPISASGTAGVDIPTKQLPGVEEMACIFHQGGYSTIGASYGNLMKWVEENGYQVAGAVREVYIRGPESGEEEKYLTEIQLPVKK
jgi:effector-binding domain-containing protein